MKTDSTGFVACNFHQQYQVTLEFDPGTPDAGDVSVFRSALEEAIGPYGIRVIAMELMK